MTEPEIHTTFLKGKKINLYNNNNPVTNTFKLGKFWDEENYDIFKKYRRINTNFIDAGAYVGTQSMIMYDILKSNNEDTLIYAFEPVNHRLTELNIVENNLENTVKLFKVGLGSINCTINVLNNTGAKEGYPGQSLVHLNGTTQFTEHKLEDFENKNGDTEIRTLDSYNLTNIGFIKIDCEGMELNILEGSKETIINNNLPPLFVEIWQNDGWREENEYYKFHYKNKILAFLNKFGYKEKQLNHHDWIFLNEEDYNKMNN